MERNGGHPHITVVIPTRERPDTLEWCLKTVVAQDYDRMSIVVSDNASGNATRDLVESARDPRIQYLNTGKRLGMSQNWEFALSHVKPGWATILGDDDGLLPNAIAAVAELIASTRVEAIRTAVCSYSWPAVTGHGYGRLTVPTRRGTELRQTARWLHRVLSGRARYTELPMLYNGGFVSTATLDRIRAQRGTLYHSSIPDVYSAISIASVIPDYLYGHCPLAINGASRHSTGTSYFAASNGTTSSPAATFRSEDNIPVHPAFRLDPDEGIPSSLQAIVYESFLQSRFLRDDRQLTTHADQLELILASARVRNHDLSRWGRLFAGKHGLDYEAVERKAARTVLTLRAATTRRKFGSVFSSRVLGSPDLPIRNVHDASLAAAGVLSSAPVGLKVLWTGAERLAGALRTRRRASLISRG